MKNLKILALLLSVMFVLPSAFAQKGLTYIDAHELNLIGKIKPTPHPYHRVDTTDTGLAPYENQLMRFPSGIAAVFKTNSSKLVIKKKYILRSNALNAPQITNAGYDLYIRSEGEWIYAGSNVCKFDKDSFTIVGDMDNTVKECLLYFPLFSELEEVKIGYDEGAVMEPIDNPFRHKVLIFGSSFTHGASTSRAGMSYPMQIQRNTGLNIINLGASGNSKLQPTFAKIIAESGADAFIFDAFSNPTVEQVQERLFKFIEIIREKNPGKPLIFLQTIYRESGNFDLRKRQNELDKRNNSKAMMAEAVKKYKDVYFVDVKDVTGTDHPTSADGTHPSDLGYYRWANGVQPEIVKVLKKYGIR